MLTHLKFVYSARASSTPRVKYLHLSNNSLINIPKRFEYCRLLNSSASDLFSTIPFSPLVKNLDIVRSWGTIILVVSLHKALHCWQIELSTGLAKADNSYASKRRATYAHDRSAARSHQPLSSLNHFKSLSNYNGESWKPILPWLKTTIIDITMFASNFRIFSRRSLHCRSYV